MRVKEKKKSQSRPNLNIQKDRSGRQAGHFRSRNILFLSVLLAAISFIVYIGTISNSFVYDDHSQILENGWIRDVKYIPEILTSSSLSFLNKSANTYRPMMHLVLMAEYSVFELNAWGYHLVNVILHTVNALLVFFLASFILTGKDAKPAGRVVAFTGPVPVAQNIPAFFSALFFALHPVNAEVVSWVSAIPELTYTLFLLASFLLYAGSEAGTRKGFYILSLCSFLLALLGKETAMALLIVVAAYDYSREGSIFKGLKRQVPFWAVAGAYMALRTASVGGLMHHKQISLSASESFLNVFPLISDYFVKLIAPINLNALYEFHAVTSVTSVRVISGFIILCLFALISFLFKRKREVFTGLAMAAAPLLPVLYIPALSTAAFADRYLYLPTAGFALILGYFIRLSLSGPSGGALSINRSRLSKAVFAIAISVSLVYSVASFKRSMVWKDDYTLWADTVSKSPNNPNAHYNFAWASQGRGDLDAAIAHYREAVRLDPGSSDAHFNLGVIYTQKKDYGTAIKEFSDTLALDPSNAAARERLTGLLRLGTEVQ